MIDRDDIDRLKEIFVTRQECDNTMDEVNKKLAKDATALAVINTKLSLIMWMLGAFGTATVGCIVKLIFGG